MYSNDNKSCEISIIKSFSFNLDRLPREKTQRNGARILSCFLTYFAQVHVCNEIELVGGGVISSHNHSAELFITTLNLGEG
jgi:hypothetical protein